MSMAHSTFTTLVGLRHAIVQAPMAGGATTPELVAAVSNAGALGSLGAAYLAPHAIRDAIASVRGLTDRPFNVNLFAPVEGGDPSAAAGVEPMLRIVAEHHAVLGLDPPTLPGDAPYGFEDQLEAVFEARVPVFSFTFGIPDRHALDRVRASGALVLGTATTVEEARLLLDAGVDAIVAQGSEAGANRGTFAAPFERSMIGTLALVPQVVDAVGDVPVVASGGIMDGRGITAARALGAAAVQMGTAFLATDESGVPEAHKRALASAREDQVLVTRAFSGRPARGIENAFMRAVHESGVAVPPYPLQNALTRAMRTEAARIDDAERLSLWAGQGVRLVRRLPAAELVELLVREERDALERLRSTADALVPVSGRDTP